jgi:predicted secreted protein
MLVRILFVCVFSLFLILAFSVQSFAQQTQAAPATSNSAVPRLIKFSGTLLETAMTYIPCSGNSLASDLFTSIP